MPSPLTILHISTRLILGGSQENTILSCEGQARLGHRVHLAFGPIYGPEGSSLDRVHTFNEIAQLQSIEPITTHELPNLVRQIAPIKDHLCYHHDLKRLIRKIKPDIVHTHSSKAGILGRAAAWSVRQPKALGFESRGLDETAAPPPSNLPAIIHTIHGPPFMPIEGGLIKRTAVRTKNAIYTRAERFAAKHCHTIVSVADAMTDQFLARGIGRPAQYTTVRSGMETEPFLCAQPGESRDEIRAELGFDPDDFVIGTVARLAEHKGHDDLLDALTDDLRAHTNWKLLWIGDGWWSDRLLGRIRDLGLQNQVISTGLVPNDRIPAMMRAMDILCHPSYREGLPRTVPQALLCAVPVVATDVDGTREACIDGQTGRLVPVADPPALGQAIRWMHGHPQQRRQMGAQGQQMCRTEFDAQRMVDRLEEVYADAIERANHE